MTQPLERRWLGDYKLPDTEVRASEGRKKIAGHAAVFNRTSQNLGGFVEEVAPGAFTKTIQEADVRGLINHDVNILLGRNRASTLTLVEDNIGLAYEIDPPDTTVARDWMALLERGDISQSSFSFRVIDVEWGLTADDFPKRTLKELALYDVGPVTFPAYLDADAGVAGRKAAFADLAERRSVKLEEVLELAEHGELRDLIAGETKPGKEPEQTSTRDLSVARRRLDLRQKLQTS
jgi:HK97 family phage prohead protease